MLAGQADRSAVRAPRPTPGWTTPDPPWMPVEPVPRPWPACAQALRSRVRPAGLGSRTPPAPAAGPERPLWVRAAGPAAWPPAVPGQGREPRPVGPRPAAGASPSGPLAARPDGPPGTGALGASRQEPTAGRAGRPGVDGPGGARQGLRVRTAAPVELPPCHRGRPGLAGPALEPAASPDPRLGPPSPPGCPLGPVAAAAEPPEGPRPPAAAPAEAEAVAPPDGQADPAAPDATGGLRDRRAGAAARNGTPVAAGAAPRDRKAERAAEPLAPRATGPERVRTQARTPTGPALELGWCAGPRGPIARWRPGPWRRPRRRRRPLTLTCRRSTGRPAAGGAKGAPVRPPSPWARLPQPDPSWAPMAWLGLSQRPAGPQHPTRRSEERRVWRPWCRSEAPWCGMVAGRERVGAARTRRLRGELRLGGGARWLAGRAMGGSGADATSRWSPERPDHPRPAQWRPGSPEWDGARGRGWAAPRRDRVAPGWPPARRWRPGARAR
jgi:hypothetical protein